MAGLYGYRWQQQRLVFLDKNPLCIYCKQQGYTEAATVVDHIIPHKECLDLFWDQNNWQALCTHCHQSHKQAIDKGTKRPVTGLDGWPLSSTEVEQ